MKVVSDSSPLISLGKLNCLFLLERLYGKITIVRAVYDEVVIKGLREFEDAVHVESFVKKRTILVEDVYIHDEWSDLNKKLGRGEVETLVYASRITADLILMDDLLARIEARRRNFRVKGTLGILYEAYKKGFLELNNFENLIQEIILRNDIWIHKELCKNVLKKAKC